MEKSNKKQYFNILTVKGAEICKIFKKGFLLNFKYYSII